MIPADASLLSAAMLVVTAWLITYFIHSTILLGVVRLVVRAFKPALAMQETLWRTAMAGAVATALWQAAGFGVTPFGHRLEPVARTQTGPAPRVVQAAPEAPVISTGMRVAAPAAHDNAMDLRDPSSEDDRVAGAATTLIPAAATGSAVEEPVPAGAEGPVAGILDRARGLVIGLPWLPLLLLGWGLGAGLGLGRLLLARLRLRRLLRGRQEIVSGRLIGMLDRLRAAAGVRRPIRLTRSPHLAGPVALGKSEICLPRRVLTDLPPGQQQSVLAHELAHLERRDPAWLWAAAVLEAVFFFQPLNRIARSRLRDLAEFRCDDWAVRHAGGNLILARCLAEVAGWVKASPALASGMAQTSSPLVRRIERLLEDRDLFREPGRRWRWLAGLLLVGLVASLAPGVTTGSYLRPDNAPWSPGSSPWPDFPFVLTPPGWTTTPLGASTWGSAPILEGGGQLGELHGAPAVQKTDPAANAALGYPSSEEDERFTWTVPSPRISQRPAGPGDRSLPPSPRRAVRLHVRTPVARERVAHGRIVRPPDRVHPLIAPGPATAARPAEPAAPVAPLSGPIRVTSPLVNGDIRIPSEKLAKLVADLNEQLDGPVTFDLGDLAAALDFEAQNGSVNFQFQLDQLAEAGYSFGFRAGLDAERLEELKKVLEEKRVLLRERAEAAEAVGLERAAEALQKIELRIETRP